MGGGVGAYFVKINTPNLSQNIFYSVMDRKKSHSIFPKLPNNVHFQIFFLTPAATEKNSNSTKSNLPSRR